MRTKLIAALAAPVVGLAAPAFAHHSAAMYEQAKVVTMTGTIMSFDWRNPHAKVSMVVKAADGKAEEWGMECSTPNILARKGWSNAALMPGDKVTVTMRPMKDGSKEGLLLSIVTAKGSTLKDHDY